MKCSEATLRLAQNDLGRSGLTLEDVRADGISPVDDASTFSPDFASKPALIIPYTGANGQPLTYSVGDRQYQFCRARYLVAPGFPLPKGRKYDQPRDSGTPPYFPRSYDWRRFDCTNDPDKPDDCVLVEGEKKAIALCRAGIPTIAIGGVFNFSDGSVALHPQIAAFAGKVRCVRICFDSDIADNPKIEQAEQRLAGQLALLGVAVHAVRLPPSDRVDVKGKPEKVGADDYLLEHGYDALFEVLMSANPFGETLIEDGVSVADLLSREVTPVEELIPGWLERGIPTFICGPGGTHKSRLALQWSLTINARRAVWGIGSSLDGRHAPKVTMVYCAAEDDENELARRSQAICRELNLRPPDCGIFLARRGRDSAFAIMQEDGRCEVRPFYFELVARLRRIPGHKLVVLDSAYDFVRFSGRAKIDEDSVNYFIKVVLQGICDQCDCTLLIPWHPSQAGSGRDAMDGWSVAWHNAPRARLSLSAVDNLEDVYELKAVKRNHSRKGPPLKIKFVDGALLPLDAVTDGGKAEDVYKACVVAAIEAARVGAPFTKQRKISTNILETISKAAGVPLRSNDVKEMLEAALYRRDLEYRDGRGKVKAGFFPLVRYDRAEECVSAVVETSVETVVIPTVETGGNPVEAEVKHG
jgi:hypothetical protein